jgi:hypothetical protein
VMTIFSDADAWLIATGLGIAMLAAWGIGWWSGQRLTGPPREAAAIKFHDAILALLGLLLGFTFSLSLAKHDQRRLQVVADSNSIGDFYTCASLLKEPVRGKLQGVLHAYAEHRLDLGSRHQGEAELQQALAQIAEMHNRMQALVGEAVDEGTPVTVPLVSTLNALTSNHAARLAAVRDRLPSSIVWLLFLASVVAMAMVGRQEGAAGEREIVARVGFILLVCMVVWVILDLNQPQRGAITVSQEPMQRVLSAMGK